MSLVAGNDLVSEDFYFVNCRYPKFIDAIRDLDDCLTMVHLFAALPAIEDRIDVKRIQNCQR